MRENRNILKPLEQTLMCHVTLRLSLRTHIHLFVPTLCKLLSQLQELGPDTARLQAQTIGTLRCLISVSTGAVVEQCHVIVSAVVHALCRTVQLSSQLSISPTHDVYIESIATLGILAQQIGHRILPFDSVIMRSIDKKGLDISPYREVSLAIRSGNWSEMDVTDREDVIASALDAGGSGLRQSLYRINEVDETKLIGMHSSSASTSHGGIGSSHYQQQQNQHGMAGLQGALFPLSPGLQPDASLMPHGSPLLGASFAVGADGFADPTAKLFLNQMNLARAWDVSQRSTAQDWHEWLWKFNIDLLRESPIPTMRACAPLAQAYEPMVQHAAHFNLHIDYACIPIDTIVLTIL